VALPIPTLRDEDLLLRPRLPEDIDALVEACQDPEIPRWTRVRSPYTRDLAVEFLAQTAEEARDGEAIGVFAVDDAGTLLGSFSIMDLKAAPDYGEIGYWLAAPARGRGIATRAVRLLTDWGHDELGLERIEIIVHEDNARSHAVPLRAGYERLAGLHPLLRVGEGEAVFVRYLSRRVQDAG
jgi:RimJ/RimL family protein N-acetyltransferase